jgi:hydrogenase maturation factor
MSTNIATASWRAGWRAPSRARRGRGRTYRFMEFCGGHTHAISRYGVEDLLPANVRMIHGPGCPVCVLPIGRIDDAIAARGAARGDALHLWRRDARAGVRQRSISLIKAKAAGADIRMVYSTLDALRIAEAEPAARSSSSPSASRRRRRRRRSRSWRPRRRASKNFSSSAITC